MKVAVERTEHVMLIDQLNLHSLVWGNGSVTLALHGWLDNAMTFSGLAPLMQPRRFIALDMPGHGWSDHRPLGCRYHFIDYVSDVCAVVANLKRAHGVEKIDLIGHSLGAAIASLVAGVIADDINRLVLIEGLGPRTREADEAVAGHRAALEHRKVKGYRPPRTITDLNLAVKARHGAGVLNESSARSLVERNIIELEEGGWQWRSDPRLQEPSHLYLTEVMVRAYLQEITAPTLVIRATEASDASSRRLMERLTVMRNAQLIDLPGAHHLHLDNPQPVADVANAFLQEAD